MRRLTKRETAEREFGRAAEGALERAVAQKQDKLKPYLDAAIAAEERRAGIPYDDIVRGSTPPCAMSDEELEQTVFRQYSPYYAGELAYRVKIARRRAKGRDYMRALRAKPLT